MNPKVRTILDLRNKKSEFVFESPITVGKLLDIKKAFNRALDGAEAKTFTFHDLRHTAATRMAEHGANPFTIARILGHSDIRLTDRYTHASDESILVALESI